MLSAKGVMVYSIEVRPVLLFLMQIGLGTEMSLLEAGYLMSQDGFGYKTATICQWNPMTVQKLSSFTKFHQKPMLAISKNKHLGQKHHYSDLPLETLIKFPI